MYPVIDPISCDGGAHGPVPTFSASRSAPSCKRVTVVRVPQLCSRTSADFPKRSAHEFVGSGLLR
jgi:hypothetical protein